MKQGLQLERSRLLGFRLSQGSNKQAICAPRRKDWKTNR
jgi:hypothetical protein